MPPHVEEGVNGFLMVRIENPDWTQHRLHKPGVAGSSPAAAIPVTVSYEPAKDYHRWPETSCSQLKTLRESSLEFYWRYEVGEAPPKSSASLDYGTLLHTWAELGDEEFWQRVSVAADTLVTATGAFSKKADEWIASLDPRLIPISPADRDKLRAQTRELLRNPEVAEIIERTVDREFNVRWPWNGHPVRARCDGRTDEFLFDWKTTRDKSPQNTWWRSAIEFGYHLQSAMYAEAGVAMGMPLHRMRFIVTSTVWPHECFVCVMPQKLIDIGKAHCERLLDELQTRREWDCWHRLDSQEVCELRVPDYAMKGA